MKTKKYNWKKNIWTGNSCFWIDPDTRINRIGDTGPYFKEYRGKDGKMIETPTCKTVEEAINWVENNQ